MKAEDRTLWKVTLRHGPPVPSEGGSLDTVAVYEIWARDEVEAAAVAASRERPEPYPPELKEVSVVRSGRLGPSPSLQ